MAVSSYVETVPLRPFPKSCMLVRSATLMALPLAFPCATTTAKKKIQIYWYVIERSSVLHITEEARRFNCLAYAHTCSFGLPEPNLYTGGAILEAESHQRGCRREAGEEMDGKKQKATSCYLNSLRQLFPSQRRRRRGIVCALLPVG